jgi:hypothetical protein
MESDAKSAGAPNRAFVVRGGTHFDILDPLTRRIAAKIVQDSGPTCSISFSREEAQTR